MTATHSLNLNPYEVAGRAAKVAKLVPWLLRKGHTAAAVATSEEVRAAAVAATGVNEPSADTWALVVGLLAEMQHLCPCCGEVAVHNAGEKCLDCRPSCAECGSADTDVYLRSCGVSLCGRCNDSDEVWASMGVDG